MAKNTRKRCCKRRREKGREEEKNEERNERKYEPELRVTAENGGLCVFNPPLGAAATDSLPLPHAHSLAVVGVAQTRFRKLPSYV